MSSDRMFQDRRQDSHFDSAFDPDQNFMFEDGGGDDMQSMQHNITSLQMLSPEDDAALQPEFMNPAFFDQSSLSPTSQNWPVAQSYEGFSTHSLQNDIVNGRPSSVVQQFGQITPPDDGTPKFSPVKQNTVTASQPTTNSTSKSERARNAANQRHAKAKKARKDSARDTKDAEDELGDVDDKKERYREKNRLAAAKCRSKKKTHTEGLEESARFITAQNNKLRAEERELRDMFSSLRHQALAHDPTQGCTCQAIHMYNNNKAQEAARGAAMQFAAQSVPSPALSSNRSAVASPVDLDGVASRTQSFSGVRPQLAQQQSRSQSVAGPMGVIPAISGRPQPSPVVADGTPWGVSPASENIQDYQSTTLNQEMELS
ncbi:Transcription factor atf21 [Pseudocercospora fuligena]|uniref:Transcription factor atf21 n=1 Tax=Pseudocercospora fuligena TaxID=685502 RepID=A0A8H6RCF1_9PEZI|nr:Transcription factor atf21 [Pseudocercospora fuligena]